MSRTAGDTFFAGPTDQPPLSGTLTVGRENVGVHIRDRLWTRSSMPQNFALPWPLARSFGPDRTALAATPARQSGTHWHLIRPEWGE